MGNRGIIVPENIEIFDLGVRYGRYGTMHTG